MAPSLTVCSLYSRRRLIPNYIHMKLSTHKAYASKWLKAVDLQGRTIPVTIRDVSVESLRNPRTGENEEKAVAWFEGKDKGLILNKTNAMILEETWGDTENMKGKQISLRPGKTNQGRDTINIEVQSVPFNNESINATSDQEYVNPDDVPPIESPGF